MTFRDHEAENVGNSNKNCNSAPNEHTFLF